MTPPLLNIILHALRSGSQEKTGALLQRAGSIEFRSLSGT